MSRSVTATTAARTAYEGSVITRAMERAGNNPHLKGHIQEVMVKDLRNLGNVFNGRTTELTRSTTARAVDLVTKEGGKVVERLQVKDVVSQSGVDKIVKQVAEGKYRTVKLVGSPETAERVNAALAKAGQTKRMVSSGVSTDTTTRLAQQAGATGSGSLGSAIGNAAKSGGAAGAMVGAGIEAVRSVTDWADGRCDGAEALGSVAKAGAKGYVTGAASSAAATAGGAMVASGLATVGAGAGLTAVATVAAPVVAAVAVGYVVSEVFDALFDW